MAQLDDIQCATCGGTFTPKSTRTKHCYRCVAVRNALAMREHTSTCRGCERAFYRSTYTRKGAGGTGVRLVDPGPHCIDCVLLGIGPRPVPMEDSCGECGKRGNPALFPGGQVCVPCVQNIEVEHAARVTQRLLTYQKWAAEQRGEQAASAPEPEPEPEESEEDRRARVRAERQAERETRAREAEERSQQIAGLAPESERLRNLKHVTVNFDDPERFIRDYPAHRVAYIHFQQYMEAKRENPALTPEEWARNTAPNKNKHTTPGAAGEIAT